MAGTEITNNNQDTNREIKTTQTGITILKIEIGTTIEQKETKQISTPQKPTQSPSHLQILRPKCNGNDADGKRIH